jgi:hypothetical protein
MNCTKPSVATMLAAALIASPATAYADCGDPGQDPCTGPVPTVGQVVAIMAELTDPNKPAASKTDAVVRPHLDRRGPRRHHRPNREPRPLGGNCRAKSNCRINCRKRRLSEPLGQRR